MKRTLLPLSLVLISGASFAQIPNGGFESWTASGMGYDDPDSWITWNILTYGSAGELSCEEISPGAVGSSCAKVTTIDVPGLGTLPGLIFVGNTTAAGWPYDQRPEALNGQIKFDIPAGDGALISAGFTRWNAGTQETIGAGVLAIPPGTQASWQDISIPITYTSSADPDTATVVIMSSSGGGVAGSTIWVDDLSFGAFASVNEAGSYSDFTLAPIANDQVQVTAGREMDELSFIDMSGRVMNTQQLAGLTATVDLTGMATGVYVARVRFATGEFASRVFVRR